ncbi:MAG: type II toxin-antitoxin system HigB family toxin [Pirellula sp.]
MLLTQRPSKPSKCHQLTIAGSNNDNRVVFNICGNEHRLVVWINYEFFTIYIRFIGAHVEYDEIDSQNI